MLSFSNTEVYRNYERFCKKNGVISVSQRKFGNDLISLGYERNKSYEKGYSSTYSFWCSDKEIAEYFLKHVPNIAEEAKAEIYEGYEYTEQDFIEEDFKGEE